MAVVSIKYLKQSDEINEKEGDVWLSTEKYDFNVSNRAVVLGCYVFVYWPKYISKNEFIPYWSIGVITDIVSDIIDDEKHKSIAYVTSINSSLLDTTGDTPMKYSTVLEELSAVYAEFSKVKRASRSEENFKKPSIQVALKELFNDHGAGIHGF